MSILQMSKVWALDGLDPLEKLILLCVADFASDDGVAWPSLRTIARKSSLCEASVRRKLRSLTKGGFLTMLPRKDRSGRDTSYEFRLFPNKMSSNVVFLGEGITQQPLQTATLEGSTQQPSSLNRHIEPLSSFAVFWSAYPRKVDRQAAEKAWSKIKPDEQLIKQILDALSWQREQADWFKEGGKFIPHPATWLNRRRWEDEPPAANRLAAKESPRRLQVAL